MNHNIWDRVDITFDILEDATDDPVVTLIVTTPAGSLSFMAEPVIVGDVLTARRVHVQGGGPHSVGWANLRLLADIVMERMALDGLIVEGAFRTSGAGAGRAPEPLRFTRRRGAAP